MFRAIERLLDGKFSAVPNWSDAHRNFVMVNLTIAVLALGSLPLWVAVAQELTFEMIVIFCLLITPLFASAMVVRTGSLDTGFLISTIGFVGLVCMVSVLTGGLQSFALIWLVVIPLEAALSQKKRIVLLSVLPSVLGLGGLVLLERTGFFISENVIGMGDPIGLIFGPLAVMLYGAFVTLRVQSIHLLASTKVMNDLDHYNLISDYTSEVLTRHDVTGKVEMVSPSSHHVFDLEPSELCGDRLFQRVHVADRPAYMKMLSDTSNSAKPQKTEFRLRRSLGLNNSKVCQSAAGEAVTHDTYTWVEMICRSHRGKDDKTPALVAVMRDISERRAHEEELLKARNDHKELSEAKSRFLANMSHELRTPLNAIIGFSEILDQELFGRLEDDKQREYVELIHQSGTHLLQVVTDILDVSKIENGTFDICPDPFDVTKLVESCTQMMSQQAHMRGVELKITLPKNMPEAVADSRACRQILINLISNAVKFSDRGQTVVIGARVDGQKIAYFVRDKGIGISNADLKRIGQPFFQADSAHDRRYEGTGLGVSVVKGLAELHKGEVHFESEPGRGTCVTVTMPLVTVRDERKVMPLKKGDTNALEPSHDSREQITA